jgi:hypothetical protein
MPCLWLDALAAALTPDRRAQTAVALVAGATALARVRVSDAALDADAPYGDTVFTGCLHVESNGRRYRVLAVEPIAAGHYAPHTYAVWLVGAEKQ